MPRLSVLLGTIALFVLSAGCSEPPQKEIDRAQQAIDSARAAGAEQYAPDTFAAATAALKQSHEAVDQRDYRLALSRAVDASDRAQEAARERVQIRSARTAAELLLPEYGNRPVEQFGVLLLDTKHRVIRTVLLSVGTLDASIVHPREVFGAAAAAGAAASRRVSSTSSWLGFGSPDG